MFLLPSHRITDDYSPDEVRSDKEKKEQGAPEPPGKTVIGPAGPRPQTRSVVEPVFLQVLHFEGFGLGIRDEPVMRFARGRKQERKMTAPKTWWTGSTTSATA